jgi:Flp pilus assembly protein TadG
MPPAPRNDKKERRMGALFAKLKRLMKNRKGQSLVETALVLPIVLLLFCGIVDFGWIMGNQLIADNSCREGARLGAVVATDSDYGSQVRSRVLSVTPAFSHSGISVSTTLTNPSNPTNGDVRVTIHYTFKILTPIAQILLGEQEYTATSTCVMKAE